MFQHIQVDQVVCVVVEESIIILQFLNIFFELDLGISWHAELIPVLIANQFKPEIILPFAGQSDLIIFQHHDETES